MNKTLLLATAAALTLIGSVTAQAATDENTTARTPVIQATQTESTAEAGAPSVTTTRTTVVTQGADMAVPVATTSPVSTVVSKDPDGTTRVTRTQTFYNFYNFDKNHNRRLDAGEFPTYTFTTWDPKGNGYVDSDEYQIMSRNWYRPYKNIDVRDFNYWDKNHDGRLEADEVSDMLHSTGLFALWDTNHDGFIDSQEYAHATFAMYDLNNDKVIDESEWMNVPR